MKLNKFKLGLITSLGVIASSSALAPLTSCGSTTHKTLDNFYKIKNLANASMSYDGFYKKLMDFTKSQQLMDKTMWKKFVEVYRNHEDIRDLGWRGEFWGKTMRGAVACYKYDCDEELYKVLEETVKDMLSTLDENGRFSTYTVEKEFQTWDVWGRKYTMTAMLAFLDICKDDSLKQQIIEALEKHADYMISKIGNDSNKIRITNTSSYWLGVNSSSILEPFVNLYEVTGQQRYLDFAKYIVDEGGIKQEAGNLIDICKNTSRMPYQYPEQKAYETMSFFEGVYRYALITGDEELRKVAIKFFNDVDITEISVIGNAGNDDEKFNNCRQTQIYKPETWSQETCVAVTWMRVMDLLYKTTGQLHYLENIQKTGLNALLGAVNYNNQYNEDKWQHQGTKIYLPFDSYSPLRTAKRGLSSGGLKYFNEDEGKYDEYYGCCACIASVAVALLASSTVTKDDDTIYINNYFNGVVNDENTKITIDGSKYFTQGKVNITIDSTSDKKLKLRMPSYVQWGPQVKIGDEVINTNSGSYFGPTKSLKDIKEFSLSFPMRLVQTRISNMISLSYGDLTLAIDEESNPSIENIDLIQMDELDFSKYEVIDNVGEDLVRISIPFKDSENKLIMRSYCSAGKYWNNEKSNVTVFINSDQ